MKNKRFHIINKVSGIIALSALLFFSCSPSRHLAENEYLYNSAKFKFEDKRIDPALIKKYERISTNKRIIGVRFHLFVYNLANPKKDKGINKVLKKIGEAPVLFDSNLVKQNKTNFSKFLSDVGYNNVLVEDHIIVKPKNKVNVIYSIQLGEPTKINSFTYFFEDTTLQRYIYADTADALIKKGMNLNKQLMQAERLRLENILRNYGYFKFSKEYIYFNVANAELPNFVDVTLNIKQSVSGEFNPSTRVKMHQQYQIRKIYISPDIQKSDSSITADTLAIDNYNIIYNGLKKLKPTVLIASCRVQPGKLYSQTDIDKTYSNLSSLGLFRYMNIRMVESPEENKAGKLDCIIDLSMRQKQSYNVELVGTYSAKDLGVKGNLVYNNYNFFQNGEHFQIGFSGGIESLKHRQGLDPIKEFGVFTLLETPKFLLPFKGEFQRKFSPHTAIRFSYNNQRQPAYIKTIATATFGYIWKGNSFNKHSLYPVDFSLVKLPDEVEPDYYNKYIKGQRLEYSFINHTILGMRYDFEFNTQSKDAQKTYVYLHSSIETAGPMVNLVNSNTNWVPDSLFFGVQYSQYFKTEIDFRFYNVINPSNKLVYRIFGGVGIAYGNSKSLPFEKMFWSGGPYGIRAWSELSLGPGSFYSKDTILKLDQRGDIKLEGNFEYRFKLFWKLEGALFADAGNIWLYKYGDKDPGEFYIKDFYKEIAIGSGFGLRFDLSFILLRADFGIKIKDPARLEAGDMWIFQNENYKIKNTTFQFGINYPF